MSGQSRSIATETPAPFSAVRLYQLSKSNSNGDIGEFMERTTPVIEE